MKQILSIITVSLFSLNLYAEHAGTVTDPYTPSEAYALAYNSYDLKYGYVEGYVTNFNNDAGSFSFFLSDEPSGQSGIAFIYTNGFDNLSADNDNFLKSGDKVLMNAYFGEMGVWGTCAGGSVYSVVRDDLAPAKGDGTLENPYNPQAACEVALNGGASGVYTQGIVAQINEIETSTYYNATYYISEDGSAAGALFVFRGKYLNGANFTESSSIKIGDKVIICGNLFNYNGKPEYNSNSYIHSFGSEEHPTTPGTIENAHELVVKNNDGEFEVFTLERISDFTLLEESSAAKMDVTYINGTVATLDADKIDYISFREKERPAEAIDLGLSVCWASTNVGATSAGRPGHYFSWGETKTKTYFPTPDYAICFMSEQDLKDNGYIDANGRITPKYDYATCNLGRDWRMPTDAEAQELIDNCTWTKASRDGTQGYLITGPNGNSIFMPFTGIFEFSSQGVSSSGQYWLANYNYTNGVMPICSSLKFDYGDFSTQYKPYKSVSTNYAFMGAVVRPVYDPGYGEGYQLSEGSLDDDGFNDSDFTTEYVQAQYTISDTQDGTSRGTTYVEIKKAGNSYRVSAYGYEKPCQYGYNDILMGEYYYTYYNEYNRPVVGRTSYRVAFTINF